MGRRHWLLAATALVAACTSDRSPNSLAQPTTPPETTDPSSTSTESSLPGSGSTSTSSTAGSSTTVGASTTTVVGASTTTSGPTAAAGSTVTGTAVAGAAGGVEPGAPPYTQTDPFAEAVRLADGTCVGWADSRGGSTAGLIVGAPVAILVPDTSEQIGSGTVTGSRWADASAGGGQWNCWFDFRATLTRAATEFDVKVGGLAPWLALPDPAAPGAFVASVSTNAGIGLIAECPAPPPEPATTVVGATTTVPPTIAVGPPVAGWSAVGQYWSNGVRSLCSSGLPVTAIARQCRPAGFGSEHVTSVVDAADPTVSYADGAAVPAGTPLTVVVAIGRVCG